MKVKKIIGTVNAKQTSDGAGVKLKRVFGYSELPAFDPFLMLDHFGSDNPKDYILGFPWHPHRGIETVTYMLKGSVKHEDSMGNSGTINEGDIQWMTAGGGIIHQEMPEKSDNGMEGFQLWVNLPAKDKMMKPRYREISADLVPIINLNENIAIKVIAGEFMSLSGPVKDLIVDCMYLDIKIKNRENVKLEASKDRKTILYIYKGEVFFPEDNKIISSNNILILDEGELIEFKSLEIDTGVLLLEGETLNEEIHWGGPIVMSTKEDLHKAFDDYNNGTFIQK